MKCSSSRSGAEDRLVYLLFEQLIDRQSTIIPIQVTLIMQPVFVKSILGDCIGIRVAPK